jgi:hypothetical protein
MLPVLLACGLPAMVGTAAPLARPAATWVTANPLRGLGELPKVHNMWEGIDPSYLDPPPGRNTTRAASLALMVVSPLRLRQQPHVLFHEPRAVS